MTFTLNQSKLKAITRSRRKVQENVHARATIGFGFTSDWLRKWRENFEPITAWSNHKPKQFANYFRHSIENCSNPMNQNPGHLKITHQNSSQKVLEG